MKTIRRYYMTLPAHVDEGLDFLPGVLLILGGLLTIGIAVS